MSAYDRIKFDTFTALNDYVIVRDMNFDEKLSHGGIIILSGDKKLEGIHPRWGKVYAVGKNQQDIKVGQYVCVSHGRWSRGLEIEDDNGEQTIRRIDPKDILLVSDEPMEDEVSGDPILYYHA